MEQIFSKIEFTTNGEGFIDITNDLNLFIEKNNFDSGILNLTSLHTSCSLTINEKSVSIKSRSSLLIISEELFGTKNNIF